MAKKKDNVDPSILEIDEGRLDEEWMGQPRLYFQYAEQLAQARKELDEAKANLEITEAELGKAIRQDPAEFFDTPKGKEKTLRLTEKMVEQAILLQEEHQIAVQRVVESKYMVDLLSGAVTALDHRKKALENLVFLHGQSYFSTPRASSSTSEEWEARKTASSGIKNRRR